MNEEVHIKKTLEGLGLSSKEAVLYLELLHLGTQPASVIARRLELPRSTAQFVAESLAKKGFVNKIIKNKITYYTGEKIANILAILEDQKDIFLKEHEMREKHFKQLMPVLNEICRRNNHDKPKVSFYEGIDGLARVYEDVLTSQEEVRSLVSYTKAHESKPAKLVIYKRRAAQGIKIKCITRDSKLAHIRKKNNSVELRESVLVNAQKYSWIPEIQFYDNKVNIASIDEKFGVIIESEQIAQAMKVLFDLAWKGALYEEKNRD